MGAAVGPVSFHSEVLEARQLQVLEATGPPLTARGFRLGGGTGLALLLGHRMSEDFDWFSTEPIRWPEHDVRKRIEGWVRELSAS